VKNLQTRHTAVWLGLDNGWFQVVKYGLLSPGTMNITVFWKDTSYNLVHRNIREVGTYIPHHMTGYCR
jgi:hypothetical protein